MEYLWEWSKIENGFSGFENLAVDFVNDIFNDYNWIPTKKTRDGNKDAYTIVFGCNLKDSNSKCWWMEAKYSNKNKYLTRYRLDSTIVSAILEKNVSQVIFVTNINVKPKVILDIQNALKNSTSCKYVFFFTKYNLELWLKQNPLYFKKYFPMCDINGLNFPSLVITEQLEIYPQNNNQMAFAEPVRIIQKEEIYYGYFSVFSNHERKTNIYANKKIVLLSPKEIILHCGNNPIKISFYLKKEYISSDIEMFFVNEIAVFPNYAISFSMQSNNKIEIKSQNMIMNKINTEIGSFSSFGNIQVHCINGLSGSGKSFIINRVIKDNNLAEHDLFYVEFAKSSIDNLSQLINLVIFILFPYLPPDEVNGSYIKSIQRHDNYISNLVLRLIENRHDFEKICNIIREIHDEEAFFPNKLFINTRFVILDDVHKLNLICLDFLINLIINLKLKNASVFFIIGGQPLFYNSIAYQKLKERCAIQQYYCQILPDDIYEYLNHKDDFKVTVSNQICESLFPSIIEFVLFIQYMIEQESNIANIDNLIFECKLFHNSGILEQHVLNEFSQIFNYNSKLRELCDNIYWSINGYSVQYENVKNLEGLSHLLSANLVRFNSQGILIPYHDIYKAYYRKHFKAHRNKDNNLQSDIDIAHEALLLLSNQQDLKHIVEQIDLLEQERHYYSIMYILQDIYENEDHQMLKNRLGFSIYIRLYYYYALASLHLSLDHSDLELFKKLQNSTMNNDDPEIIQIHECATWELINLYYAWLDFECSEKNINHLYMILKKEQEMKMIDLNINKCFRFHDIKVMETLLASEKNVPNTQEIFQINSANMIKKKFYYRNYSFAIRYAITIVCKNYDRAILLLETSGKKILEKYGSENRYYLWAQFYLNYFKMLYHSDASLLNLIIDSCNKLKKNHFMDYRKMILGVAAYYFSKNEMDKGNQYLLSDVYVKREYRPRQKAFYFEIIALSEALQDNFNTAIHYLHESAKLFCQLPSFLEVIEHNLQILYENRFVKWNVRFYFHNILENDVYYVDPRCAT